LRDLKVNLTVTELSNEMFVKFIDAMIDKAENGLIKILRPLDGNPIAVHNII